MGGELQIDGVEAHQRLPAFDHLPGIHKPLQHLAGDAKAQVALDPSRYGPGEGARIGNCGLRGSGTHQRRFAAWIGLRFLAASDQRKRQYADEGR
ncbi:hypothetical protein D9M69_728810 [compost metagenome]